MEHRYIDGTFIQLLDAHSDWSTTQWEKFFDILLQLRVKHIVLQWTELEKSQHVHPDSPILATVMGMAQRFDMTVTVGLASNPEYWEYVSADIEDRRRYLDSALRRSIDTARRILGTVQEHASFAGWYITEEIDDENWNTAAAREVLANYVKTLTTQLHQLTPRGKVAISGFANGTTPNATVRSLWTDLFAAGIDIAMFQDGVGAGKLSIDKAAEYFTTLRNAATLQGKQLWPVVELYERSRPADAQQTAFSAVAASPDRVCRQLTVASAYGGYVIAFSIPDYMWPTGSAEQQALYHHYLDNQCSGK